MTKDLNKNAINYFPSYSGDNKDFLILLNKTSDILCKWFSQTKNSSPLPLRNDFIPTFPESLGCDLDSLLDEIQNLIYSSFNPSHPGALANLDPPPLLVSIIGDFIAAGLNNNLLAEELSPSISKLENELCKWVAKKIGFNESSGGITASGGTLNNLNALVTAKYNSNKTIDHEAFLILSEDAHVSFKKCARVIGVKEEYIILIKTDSLGRMSVPALKDTIKSIYSSGRNIFAVVATFGTTIRGSLDPIDEISEVCLQNNIWLHIDASIGGVFWLADEKIDQVNYLKKCNANSVTINPQKLLGIAKTSSILVVSKYDNLQKTFQTGLPYIDTSEDKINRGELGVQGSRPAEIIKLWLGLRFLGVKGIETLLSQSVEKRKLFEHLLDKKKFKIYSGPLHIVSFLPNNMKVQKSNKWTSEAKSILLQNKFMISRPLYKDQYFLRVVFGNFNTDKSHILMLADLLNNLSI
tara:strand:- start:9529 stop:10929 length:1401 start_codon:yes stop_codon:yes gene_type:complete